MKRQRPASSGQRPASNDGGPGFLAERIAAALFTGGFGERATQLRLMQGERILGGWCERAVAQVIEANLGGEWGRLSRACAAFFDALRAKEAKGAKGAKGGGQGAAAVLSDAQAGRLLALAGRRAR